MSGNILVINVDIREIRVALIEEGILAELHIERLSSRSTLGNVYLGKVSRVLPGMQAAFIDIGEDRAAFLHVEDLIRPDDFEAYLSGARDDAADTGGAGEGEEEGEPAAGEAPADSDRDEDEGEAPDKGAGDDEIALNRNAMEGIATVLNGLTLKAGDEVIATKYCYDSNLAILRQRAELPPRRQIWCKSAVPWSSNIEAVPKV